MNKKLIRLTESDLHKIVKESVNRILNEGMFDFFKRQPSKEEMRQQRIENYYETNIIKSLRQAAMSFKVHNSDPLYINALKLCIKARDEGVFEPWRLQDFYEEYYVTPRTNLLNHNNWLLNRGETWPRPINMEALG